MRSKILSAALLTPVLALSACGSSGKPVNTAAYTCADFKKSLNTTGDNTSGRFINELRTQAKLGKDEQTERRAITLGIFFACRGKAGTTKPATLAIANAKQLAVGKFHAPAPARKKKSTK